MRSFVLGLAVAVAFAGTSVAQTTSRTTGTIKPTTTQTKTPVAQKAAPARSAQRPTPQQATTPKAVRASGRYGGFAMTAPPPPPPVLDTTSPRSLNLVNANTGEALSVTYWSNGSYQRAALDKLNHFLRDWRENEQTEMDPLLFDVLWHTMNTVGFSGTVEVLSAFRSPSTNAWLASVSRGVASDSQHINGNAMDVVFPGVSAFQIRQAARALNMGGVGFYPRSGFVHLDTGPVRYW